MKKPSVLILHASGTNRDAEAARACELAGGTAEIVHINQMRLGERSFAAYDMLLIPGGFSYGDALGAGGRLALACCPEMPQLAIRKWQIRADLQR